MRFSGTVFTGPRVHVWTVGQLGEKKFSVFKQQQQQQQQQQQGGQSLER